MFIEITRTDAKQPFHVAFKHGNGKRTFWCENLTSRAKALQAITTHAQQFVLDVAEVNIVKRWDLASGLAVVASNGIVEYFAIEIRERDLREAKA